MNAFRATEQQGIYHVTQQVTEEDILHFAQKLIQKRFKRGKQIKHSSDAADLFMHHLQHRENEVLGALFLDTKNRVITFEILFQGSINSSSVYPREVVKRALKHNAAAIILTHNHPSGVPDPSNADYEVTEQLQKALAMMEIKLVDHIIMGGCEFVSLASLGAI
jgi:DNA repair protein RadC